MHLEANAHSVQYMYTTTNLAGFIDDTVSLWTQAFYQALLIGASWGVSLRLDLPREQIYLVSLTE